jgi:hypothetical protein
MQLAIENVARQYRRDVQGLGDFTVELGPGILGLAGSKRRRLAHADAQPSDHRARDRGQRHWEHGCWLSIAKYELPVVEAASLELTENDLCCTIGASWNMLPPRFATEGGAISLVEPVS